MKEIRELKKEIEVEYCYLEQKSIPFKKPKLIELKRLIDYAENLETWVEHTEKDLLLEMVDRTREYVYYVIREGKIFPHNRK